MEFFFRKQELKKVNNLLLKANPFASYEEAFEVIRTKRRGRFIISFLNMYAIQLSLKNEEFYSALLSSDLLLIDGIALKFLCRAMNFFYGINMNGSDFIPALIDNFDKSKYLVFASDENAINLFKSKHNHLQLVSCLDGFQDCESYLNEAQKYRSDIILLGMGMPKQEILSSKINSDNIIINGGAVVDYMSGYKVRAPKFFTKYKIEWLYRMFYEPDRLFKRYTRGLFIFLKIIISNHIVNKNRKDGKVFRLQKT
jgi:exopolysaccharide biosynthesis WecB/TagA/CpsF family protein